LSFCVLCLCSKLPAGSYHLEVISIDHHFVPLRIDVSAKEDGRVRAFYFSTEDASSAPQRVQYPLLLRPVGIPVYFTKPQAFDPFSLLKNPMMIMMLVFGVMMFVMPSMTAAVQDQQQQMQREQREAPAVTGASPKTAGGGKSRKSGVQSN
jgi:hypothetical protein